MKRSWIGTYTDIGKNGQDEEVSFQIDVDLDNNLNFKGKVWEEKFYSHSQLMIDVKGFINEDHISFIKTYPCLFEIDENYDVVIDTSKKGHDVTYDGYWNVQTKKWEGFWEVKGLSILVREGYYEEEVIIGPFEMKLMD